MHGNSACGRAPAIMAAMASKVSGTDARPARCPAPPPAAPPPLGSTAPCARPPPWRPFAAPAHPTRACIIIWAWRPGAPAYPHSRPGRISKAARAHGFRTKHDRDKAARPAAPSHEPDRPRSRSLHRCSKAGRVKLGARTACRLPGKIFPYLQGGRMPVPSLSPAAPARSSAADTSAAGAPMRARTPASAAPAP